MCIVLGKHRNLADTIYPKFKAVTGKSSECSSMEDPPVHCKNVVQRNKINPH